MASWKLEWRSAGGAWQQKKEKRLALPLYPEECALRHRDLGYILAWCVVVSGLTLLMEGNRNRLILLLVEVKGGSQGLALLVS